MSAPTFPPEHFGDWTLRKAMPGRWRLSRKECNIDVDARWDTVGACIGREPADFPPIAAIERLLELRREANHEAPKEQAWSYGSPPTSGTYFVQHRADPDCEPLPVEAEWLTGLSANPFGSWRWFGPMTELPEPDAPWPTTDSEPAPPSIAEDLREPESGAFERAEIVPIKLAPGLYETPGISRPGGPLTLETIRGAMVVLGDGSMIKPSETPIGRAAVREAILRAPSGGVAAGVAAMSAIEIIPVGVSGRTIREEPIGPPEIGSWWWVEREGQGDDMERLGCVTTIGSNFIALTGVAHRGSWTTRIPIGEFRDRCRFEPNAEEVIAGNVRRLQAEATELMDRARGLATRLSIRIGDGSGPSVETQALALRSGEPVKAYQAALATAKTETLPQLFREIRDKSELAATWAKASLIPLEAQADQLKPLMGAIESRIFNVSLYAGLTEQVVEISGGEPADTAEPVRIFQRRHYMDEELLARYQAGGMTFAEIGDFDRWLAAADNRDRLLPFPRCVVAFQVRRNVKDREVYNLSSFIQVLEGKRSDKFTYLYLRNGDRVYRLSTEIDFGSKLFPDFDAQPFADRTWARLFAGNVRELVPQGEYEALREKDREEAREKRVAPKADRWRFRSDRTRDLEPFEPSSLYYDDIARMVAEQAEAHNRLVLVLQGLLDRSPVWEPHPPWQLWTPAGFEAGARLVYDDSRALVSGPAPDFEAYRARLNASLAVGSLTTGQMDAWLLHEGRRESDRRDRDYRTREHTYRPDRYHPYGDPGPGLVARVTRLRKSRTAGLICGWDWTKERAWTPGHWRHEDKPVPRTFSAPASALLNVDAYQAGDFYLFFDDPRTRAEYLKWGALLLAAEDWKAGKRPQATAKGPQ